MQEVRKAVIPAAGLGTRFLPATKAQPKEMLPIVDKPAIQFVVEEAVAAGIEDILIITGRGKRAIEDHFDYSVELEALLQEKKRTTELQMIRAISDMAQIYYVRQKEPLGLGHAVLCARKFIGREPFAVLLGDDIIDSAVPCIGQLAAVYAEKGGTVLGVQPVDWSVVHKYGIVEKEMEEGPLCRVKGLVEKPAGDRAPSNLAVLGRYVLEPEIFDILEHTAPGAGGEIQLTDALHELCATRPVWAYSFKGRRYDVGDRLGFLQATIEYALHREELSGELISYLRRLVDEDPALQEKDIG
ncbi:MAG: UTP--glucose-1-phosphate uridylyltransferase GalU [Firmicutes bacterium]|nr:UTP--glucose-1-phosphate uridylyltransferase GalU [Bacillota bacterium]